MSEEWRAIPGHPGYEASSEGQIRSWARGAVRVLKPFALPTGHLCINLGRAHRYSVHRLVALTFHGPRPEGLIVRHLDSDPSNNRPENLAYGTQSQNLRDGVLAGTHVHAKKTHCPRGHEYSEANTRVKIQRNGFPARWCRACEVIRNRAYLERKKAMA